MRTVKVKWKAILLITIAISILAASETQASYVQKVKGIVGFLNDSSWACSLFYAQEAYGEHPAKGWYSYIEYKSWPVRYYKFRIACIEVKGAYATFSGQIAKTNVSSWSGKWVQVWVFDGGTPGKEGDYIISKFCDNDPACGEAMPLEMIPISSGNLKVHYSPNIVLGIAASGAPIVGIVNVKGANGATASSPIEADGSYSIDTTDLEAPYILYAVGTVSGKSISIYSSGVGPNINITPVTDFILRNAYGGQAEDAYTSWESFQVSETGLNASENHVQNQLDPLLSAMGVPDNVDLMSSPFDVYQPGMDAVLEGLDISYDGDAATVTNELTGSSYTDDITNPADPTGLPDSDEADVQLVLTDGEAINMVWQVLEDMYAESSPSSTDLDSWFNTYVADDFLDDGSSKTDEFYDWVSGDGGPSVGFSLSSMIVEPMDVTGTIYTKGYQIRCYYTDQSVSDSFLTFMVFDGMNWLWYGNQMWVDVGFKAHAQMQIDINDISTFYTGLAVTLWDDSNYAYNQGARSGIVTGPGFPVEGQILAHYYPEPFFRLYPPDVWGHPSGGWGYWLDDNVISAIPDNAEYTFNLYAEAPDMVSLNDTPLWSYTKTLPKRPVLNSDLDGSFFPSLITPSSHDVSAANIPGVLNVSWTNPPNMYVDYMNLGWIGWDGSEYLIGTDVEEGMTTATLDSSGLPGTSGAQLYMHGEDMYERRFGLGWMFQSP